MNSTMNSIDLDIDEQLEKCRLCGATVGVSILDPDGVMVSITRLDTISGSKKDMQVPLCYDHVADILTPQTDPTHLIYDSRIERITGGCLWRNGEYPYERYVTPNQFPSWLLGVAMIVQQALNNPYEGDA